jgi:hypothetical protein
MHLTSASDHPHFKWLMEELSQAQQSGQHEVVMLLSSGLEFAEACNTAWHEVLAAHGEDLIGVELCDARSERYAAILRDASEPGRFRAQFYDASGISGHQTRDSAEEVLEELIRDGYRMLAPGAMQRLSQSREWALGTLMANLIAQVNAGRMTYQGMHDAMAEAEARLG